MPGGRESRAQRAPELVPRRQLSPVPASPLHPHSRASLRTTDLAISPAAAAGLCSPPRQVTARVYTLIKENHFDDAIILLEEFRQSFQKVRLPPA